MKWGVRRYQNYDGSYTEAGKVRYRNNDSSLTKQRKALYTDNSPEKLKAYVEAAKEYQDAAHKFYTNPNSPDRKKFDSYIKKEFYESRIRYFNGDYENDKSVNNDWLDELIADELYTNRTKSDRDISKKKEKADRAEEDYVMSVIKELGKKSMYDAGYKYNEPFKDVSGEDINKKIADMNKEAMKGKGSEHTEYIKMVNQITKQLEDEYGYEIVDDMNYKRYGI